MKKIKEVRNGVRLLVIWETKNGNYIGEVYEGAYQRGQWSQRATFYAMYGEATENRVKEYFNFG